ncbi:MAG: alpha-isopropylmalate synthase regulatory domain-containing protein, partial [Acidimicrobiales bacterium]
KHSGRAAFKDTLEKMGIEIHGDALQAAFERFKELADRKVQLSDADLEAIVAEEMGATVDHAFELLSLATAGGSVGTGNTPQADVVLSVNGEKREAHAEGDGMVAASCQAIKEATGIEGRLTDYTVTSVTGGVDALADVALAFETTEGVKVSGRGLSGDVVEASARAFVAALNKVYRVQQSGEDPNAVLRPGSLDFDL